MKDKKIINLALVASGGGTGANAIMEAWVDGKIPGVNIEFLISTNGCAGCIEKARKHKVKSFVVNYEKNNPEKFNQKVKNFMKTWEIDLIFLVGCIVKMPLIEGIPCYNIHPADPQLFGGEGMYGLAPHIKFLQALKKDIDDDDLERLPEWEPYTRPTIHRIIEEYDKGPELLSLKVKIPKDIIDDLTNIRADDKDGMKKLAERLQQHVSPHEWRLLPIAVRMAARKLVTA